MNGSAIAYFLALFSGILAYETIETFLGEIFFLIAISYLILGSFWNDLGKNPNEKKQEPIN